MKKLLIALLVTIVLLPLVVAGAGPTDVGDCMPGSYSGYTLVGTLFVPGTDDPLEPGGYPPIVSFSGLVPGQYLIEASGTYCPGGDWESDAEYVRKGDGPWSDFVPGYETDPLGEGLDELWVDDTQVEWSGGVFSPDHVYTLPWTVSGDTLTFQIKDWYAYNNSGGLCVGIFYFEPVIELGIDIKPQSCPNPLNVKDKGVMPVAILGMDDFDVTTVDPASVRLEGVAPLRWALEDVATPFEPLLGKQDCFQDCTTEGPDGYLDLTLKFGAQELIAALGEVEDGECLVLELTGNLKEEYDGGAFVGEDVVWIKVKGM